MILFWFELIVFALRAILIARKRCNSVEEDHTMSPIDRPEWAGCNQDRQPLPRNDHRLSCKARTRAAARATATPPGTRTPTPEQLHRHDPGGHRSLGKRVCVTTVPSGFGMTATGTKAGSPSPSFCTDHAGNRSSGKRSKPSRACRRQSES